MVIIEISIIDYQLSIALKITKGIGPGPMHRGNLDSFDLTKNGPMLQLTFK
jgi:hypothetical protein